MTSGERMIEAPPQALAPSVSRQLPLPRIPALDGIRGVAILLVMMFHLNMVPAVGRLALAWSRVTQYGGLGVDVFFVLSGFLITGVLLDADEKPHYFRNFYARRILRIFPLYYAVTAFSFWILPHVLPWTRVKFAQVNRDAIWYWFHLSNFSIARRGAFVHGIMDVSWSLAIEEQFYLVWPAIVFFLRRSLYWICLAVISVSCISRVLLTGLGTSPVAIYTLTFCRLDGLALGALVALAARKLPRNTLAFWALAGAAASCALPIAASLPLKPWVALLDAALTHLLVSTLTASAILTVIIHAQFAPIRIFSLSPLRALGRYSYALYLFHYPIAAAFRDRFLPPAPMPLFYGSSLPLQFVFYLAAGGAAFVAARISWRLFESRFLRLKHFFE
jgi:peptidoglycan/LPS O-acetylase OafA/YrhL